MQETEALVVEKKDELYAPVASALVAAAEAWIKGACAMAVKFPRDLDVVRQKLLHECERPSFAAAALYSKPVGTTKVTGLSIRFAEQAIASMQHIHVSTLTLAETDDWRKIEVRVWDAQNMVSYADETTIQKTIERRSVAKGQEVIRTRPNRSGELLYIIRAEEGDLLNQVNAAKSKAIRNAGLRLVPGWLLDECKEAVNETMRKRDKSDPDKAKREIFDSFAALGVSVDLLKSYIGHDKPVLQPEELQELRKLYTAIKDGETTIQAALDIKNDKQPEADKTKGVAALKSRLSGNDRLINQNEIDDLTAICDELKVQPLAFVGLLQQFGVTAPQQLKLSQLPAVHEAIRRGR